MPFDVAHKYMDTASELEAGQQSRSIFQNI